MDGDGGNYYDALLLSAAGKGRALFQFLRIQTRVKQYCMAQLVHGHLD